MPDTQIAYREIRILIEPTETVVFAFCESTGADFDRAHGWHAKTYPAGAAASILQDLAKDPPQLWERRTPTGTRRA